MLYSIRLPNFIVLFLLILENLGNMGIVIICYPACDVINFVNNINFLMMSFFYMIKKSEQKLKMM